MSSGSLPAITPATYNLITYSGVVQGGGTFVAGTLPAGASGGYIVNNAGATAIQLVVPAPSTASVTWVGAPTNSWDLSGSNVWVQTGTATPANYTNGESVVFGDTATNFSVNLAVAVSPASVLITNNLHNYVISGLGSISNALSQPASLSKQGTASLTLDTANVYTGNTVVGAGTLSVGRRGRHSERSHC